MRGRIAEHRETGIESAKILGAALPECGESPHRFFRSRLISARSPAPSFSGRCRLRGRVRLAACGAIPIKQHAVCPQVADQRVQIVRKLLIIQQRRHQTLPLRRGAQSFARVSNRSLQPVSSFFCGGHRRIRLVDYAVQFFGRFCQCAGGLV